MKKIIVFFIVFSFVNQIKYSFLPLNTMLLLGIMGLLLFFYNYQMKRERHYQYLIKLYVFCFIPMLISSIPATIVNFTDFYFIRDLIVIPVIYIFSAYFVAFLIRSTYEDANLQKFVELYLLSIILQCFLTLVMILFPDIQLLLMKLVSYSELQENKLVGAIGLRAIGFGIEFFGAGILMCIALILCISQFFENLTFSRKLYYILSYVFILSIGTLLARTTLIGAVISLVVFIGLKIKKSYKFTLTLSVFFVLAFFSFLVIKDSLIDYLYNIDNNYITFGLEIFLNQIQGNGFESKSTSSLFTMYETLPDNIFTWIFGDGYFRDLHDPLFGYYKNIDVGYIRIIFATGIIGLLCYLICNIQILLKAFNRNFFLNRDKKVYLKLSLMFLFLALMSKGLIVIIPLFAFLSFAKRDNSNYFYETNNLPQI